MKPELTIAIPTFDRNVLLRDHLALLLPQLNEHCRLLVLDNASPTPVADTLADLLAQYPAAAVQVKRNRVNVGSSANVMRCYELCETPWLWVLGDDDPPLPDAVATALLEIDSHPDCLLVNCQSVHDTGEKEIITDGLDEFVRAIPNFVTLTLISNTLVRADRLAPHVRTGCFFAYSLYPHVACWLAAFAAEGGRACFGTRRLVAWDPDASEWSRVMAALGMGVLLDLPMPMAVRRELAPRLIGVSGRLSSLAIKLLGQIGETLDAATARHLYDQAWHRLYSLRFSPTNWLVRHAGRLMLTFPGPSRAMYRAYRRLRGNPVTEQPPNEMRRM